MTGGSSSKGTLTGRKIFAILLAFFRVVFGVNATMTVLAVKTLSGTEVHSAYAASLAYQGEIDAAQKQNARHWNVTAAARRDGAGDVALSVEARDSAGLPIAGLDLIVRLQRPVDKRFDRDVTLSEQPGGIYQAKLTDVAAGQWDLVIEADTGGATMFQSRSRIVLN